jgi:hypothetical protein
LVDLANKTASPPPECDACLSGVPLVGSFFDLRRDYKVAKSQ